MVLCRFYLQGRCKYGHECRFEHSDTSGFYDGGSQHSYSTSQNDRYHYVKPQQTSHDILNNEPKPITQICEIVNQDMIAADKGGQWPLSCYAPIKENHNILGLDDVSPEELRWQMYDAMQSGTIEECKRQTQALLLTAAMKRNMLTSHNAEAYSIIQTIYNSTETTSTQFGSAGFEGTSSIPNYSASIFGGSPSVFGSSTANVFTGQPASVFGGSTTSTQPPSGLFGVAAAAASSNLFSQSPSSLFGSSSTSTGLFGATAPPPGLFGAAAAAATGTAGLFGASLPPSGLFGSAAASIQSSSVLFGADPLQSAGVFGSPTTLHPPSLFGATPIVQSPSLFGAPPASQSASIFGGSSSSQFGQTRTFVETTRQASTAPAFVSSDASVVTLYSAISELAENMLNAFKAKTFTMGKVPIRQPPRELC